MAHWHDGRTELFKKAIAETGQVCIMVRDVPKDVDAGAGRTETKQDDNPFESKDIEEPASKCISLKEGFNIKKTTIFYVYQT